MSSCSTRRGNVIAGVRLRRLVCHRARSARRADPLPVDRAEHGCDSPVVASLGLVATQSRGDGKPHVASPARRTSHEGAAVPCARFALGRCWPRSASAEGEAVNIQPAPTNSAGDMTLAGWRYIDGMCQTPPSVARQNELRPSMLDVRCYDVAVSVRRRSTLDYGCSLMLDVWICNRV